VLNAGIDPLQRWGLPSGVTVSTLGAAGAASIAEHALFLLLALLRQAPALLEQQQRAEWATEPMAATIESLQDERVAVLGIGHIGRKIAALTMAFGAEPIGVARSARSDPLGFEIMPLACLGEVLERCTSVVVALPLVPATERLLDAATLARLPRGARLVNVSRGGIVDTDALVAALNSGALGGAALDVTDPEPLPPAHPLWAMPNVLVTPHVAWAGALDKKQRELDAVVVENAYRFVRGEPLLNVAMTHS
jgi:phosphoglycerate dehydrogenase-like enzyme